MEESKWVSSIPGTAIDEIIACDTKLLVKCHTTASSARCLACGQASTHIHSYRKRRVLDLPCGEHAVNFELRVRHFRCPNANCPRKTFAERLPPQVAVRARRTQRLNRTLCVIGLHLGGEAGQRLCRKIRMPISSDTLLRLLRQEQPVVTTPRVLGVDDWAWRRGHRYGTLLVDLQTHRPVDLLPDRTAETLATWLQKHPGIRLITRDRSGEYARGIRVGAPHAKQVADRWHLLHNLHDVLERLLQRKRADLECLPVVSNAANLPPFSAFDRSLDRRVGDDLRRQAAQARRHARYEKVKILQKQGRKIKQIARTLKMAWTTVRQFYRAERYPEPKERRRRASMVDPFVPYLQRRWDKGIHNAMQLWREIRTQGYRGSHRMVMLWAQLRRSPTEHRPGPRLQVAPRSTVASTRNGLPRSQQLVWLLLRPPDALDATQHQWLAHIQRDPFIAKAYQLAQQFVQMLQQHATQHLSTLLKGCQKSEVDELAHFAITLRHDLAAVRAGLKLPWSNGVVEGHVNRLKFIKRQMFGRAKFDLLRIRVLAQP